MKRSITCVVCMLLTLCILINAYTISSNAQAAFYSQATTLSIKNHIEKDAKIVGGTAQGACADSKYAYIAINTGSTTILKYDINTFKLVKKKSGLGLNHANDMTYNEKLNRIIVCNNAPNYNLISFVDPDSLTVTGTKKIKHKIYSISYNSTYNRYVVGLSGTYNFAILDSDFKLIKKYKGYKSGYLRQGGDCDDNYLYFSQSGSGGNLIVIYDWNGNFVDTVSVNKSFEIENLFHHKNTLYTTLHYFGNYIYRLGINNKTAIKFKVNFKSGGGSSKMDSISVTYGKKTKLPKCKFTREGYRFAGWIMRRDSSNQYYGRKTPYSKAQWLDKKDVYEYVLYKDETKLSKTTKIGDITATAFWIADEYTINYDNSGGQGIMNSVNVEYDQPYLLDKNTFTKSGYIFGGWIAQRDYDHKIYGYAKGKSEPKWLLKKDVVKSHIFTDTQFVSKLTYDGDVTLYANWQLAFRFSESGTVLERYNGLDSDVVFPEDSNSVTTIADNAFDNSVNMRTVTFPSSITTIGDSIFRHCVNLNTVYFEDTLPANTHKNSFDSYMPKICILKKDGKEYLMSTFLCDLTYQNMLSNYNKIFS